MMTEERRAFLVLRLVNALDWMSREEDWQRRSLLVTRTMGTIQTLGETKEAIFDMPLKYLVTVYDNFRVYQDKLNDAIDIDDRKEREEAIFEFYLWLHEIKLLRPDE